jgi:hypothetical protein
MRRAGGARKKRKEQGIMFSQWHTQRNIDAKRALRMPQDDYVARRKDIPKKGVKNLFS